MMVAQWNDVALHSGSSFTTSSFQCVLITDGSASYAVFIYECGGMEWSGATIGWAASSSLYKEHLYSGSSNSRLIGCRHSSTYSAIIFRLDDTYCASHRFGCNNGNCLPQSYVCDVDNDCGDYSDEDNCCEYDEFRCDNGNCESQHYVCDGYNNCGDNSDEWECELYQFRCDNGNCELQSYVCDGYDDCGDNSDEEQGCCEYDEFRCDNGNCESERYVCDGHNNCGDNSDEERGCSVACASYEFKCDSGRCIYDEYECDGDNDCGDNSDEEDCPELNIGLAVGLSVGLFFLVAFIVVPIIVCVLIYYASYRRRQAVATRIVATRPTAGVSTVVTSNQDTSFTTAAPYPTQQTRYKDAQFSSQVAPPSYDAASAYPLLNQGYPQFQPNPTAAYPPQQSEPYPNQAQAQPPAVPANLVQPPPT